MLKHLKNFLPILLCLAAAPLIKRFCYDRTDGFALYKICSSFKFNEEWEVPAPTLAQDDLKKILNQPYRYFARGAQSYVFLSEDGNTVLKFFRLYHLRPSRWMTDLVFPPSLQLFQVSKILERQTSLDKDFKSYVIAYNELKEETGLIYLHLNKTDHLKQKITVYDKLNIAYELDLDQMEFLVQKRATLVYPAIDVMPEEDAREAISGLVGLLALRSNKGIFDKDPDLNTNFGFIGKVPVQIDIGRFRPATVVVTPEEKRDELIRITDNFRQWLDQRHPALSTHLMHEIACAF